MSNTITNAPYTYLLKKSDHQYDLFVYIPVPSGHSVRFPERIDAPPNHDNFFFDRKITFIDCEVVKSEGEATQNYKRFTLTRRSNSEEDTVEVRVLLPANKDQYIWFNRSIVFLDDADNPSVTDTPQNWPPRGDLAVGAPYTFIGKLDDFFKANRKEEVDFLVHLFVPLKEAFPLRNSDFHARKIQTGSGEASWNIDMKSGQVSSAGSEITSRGLGNNPGSSPTAPRRLRVHIRPEFGRIDKPTPPPRGSGGDNNNIFIRK